MMRLKSHLNAPPGNFYYRFLFKNGVEQVWYGDKSEPFAHTFGPDPIPETVADRLLLFRKGNGLAGATEGECLQAVDNFTCTRLGNMTAFCFSTDKTFQQLAAEAQPRKGCKTCGHRV